MHPDYVIEWRISRMVSLYTIPLYFKRYMLITQLLSVDLA